MKTKKPIAEIQVSEMMTRQVHSLMANDSIQDAVALMLDHNLTSIPVIGPENNCIGILSHSDLTELFLQEDDELSRVLDTPRLSMEWLNRTLDTCDARQVSELMTHEVTTIREDQTLSETCKALVRGRIHHLPVVDDQDQITGIVSAFDVVKTIASQE